MWRGLFLNKHLQHSCQRFYKETVSGKLKEQRQQSPQEKNSYFSTGLWDGWVRNKQILNLRNIFLPVFYVFPM